MIPWIQIETLQLLSTFMIGQMMAIWLVLSTVFAQNVKSVLPFCTLITVHYCILDILSRQMCMFQNIEYRRLNHEQVGFSMLCSIT